MFENVLIADDSLLARRMLTAAVQGTLPEVRIKEAVDGEDAFAKMVDTPAQIVFMDYNMPKMTGIEAIEKIAEHFPETVFALVTANTQKVLQTRIEHLNVTLILKPIDKSKVESFLKGLSGG